MKKILFFALVSLICSSSSCKPDPTPIATDNGILSLTFKPTYDSKPLIINKIYDYNGKKVRFTKWQFFINNNCFVKAGTNPTSFCVNDNSAALIDFTTLDDSLKSVNGLKVTLNNLSVGSFQSLNFIVGLGPALNDKLPKDFPSSSPLSDGTNYWSGWNSFIFSKLEGLMDKDGDGKFETGITLHTGGRTNTFAAAIYTEFQIDEKGSTNLNLDVNLTELLRGIDLTTVNSTHQTGDEPTMLKMMGNYLAAITVK